MMFYRKRRETKPKAVFYPQASAKDVYDYFIHGLVDSLYFHDNNPKELKEFPPKVQNAIKVYNDLFAKGRELYLKMHSNYPIFNRERKLVVPSITIAQLGVSNQDYPSNDVNMEPTTPTLDDLALSLFRVFVGTSKIGSGLGQTDKVRINYYSKNLLIYSHFQEEINEVQMKALADFEDQFETFSGLLKPLPADLKQLLCGYKHEHGYYLQQFLAVIFRLEILKSGFSVDNSRIWALSRLSKTETSKEHLITRNRVVRCKQEEAEVQSHTHEVTPDPVDNSGQS
ncbi:hypothetical protein Tco_0422260 [Tanacetum coccineum]